MNTTISTESGRVERSPSLPQPAQDRLLRAAMVENAAFSALSGLVIAAGSAALDGWLGVDRRVLLGVGLALVGWAGLLLLPARRPALVRPIGRLAVGGDALWAAGAAALILFTDVLTGQGEFALAAASAVVAALAAFQAFGLHRIVGASAGVYEVERLIHTSPEAAWAVIADVGRYAELNDGGGVIAKVEILEGERVGMRRRCINPQGESWTETCSLWEKGRRYSFVVDTDAPDYPYPLQSLVATWEVDPHPLGSVIRFRAEYTPKGGMLTRWLTERALRRMGRRAGEKLLERWGAEATSA
jgi:hypothetical protein